MLTLVNHLSRVIYTRKPPLYLNRVQAGFPSPADDYIDRHLDLNELMVSHPAATFFVQVSGDSMIESGIIDGDYLVVNRALKPRNGKVVVAAVNGELTVKRFYQQGDELELRPDNAAYAPIKISTETELNIWGVVTGVVRKLA